MSKKTNKFIALAISGLIAGGVMAPNAYAGDHAEAEGDHADKASCKGENGCKSKGSCKAEEGEEHGDKNACSGKDGCNGK
jgi:hypothetical protein